MMKEILFATSNQRKISEARAACDSFDIKINQLEVNIDEIQHHDSMFISRHKASEAFKFVGKPIVITDTSWNIPAVNGFPGGYMKDVAQWFSPEDFINLVYVKQDKRISFTETVVYQDENEVKIFSQEYWGVIAENPRGNGNSIERVAEFEGFTIAEKHDQGGFSHDPKDYIWNQFAQWYSQKP